MKRMMLTLMAAMFMLAAFASIAGAFTMSEKVVIADELVAIARVPAGGYSAQERIDRVNDRLRYIYGFEPLHPGAVRAVPVGNTMVIMVGRTPLVTVTPRDARANNATVSGLTQVWLQQTRAALPMARPTPAIPG